MFKIEKYTEISATLPTPQKDSGSVLKTMWSFTALHKHANYEVRKPTDDFAAVNHLN